MQVDGIHWRTGGAPGGRDGARDPILSVLAPDAATILNEPEARWHWAAVKAVRPSGLTVWRASPQLKPADVGWDAHVFSREVFRNLDAHHDMTGRYPDEVLLLNELNLDYERGESHNDGGAFDTNPANWPSLYTKIARFMGDLLDHCRERATRRDNFTPRWWWQGWSPGHGELEPGIAAIWVPVARRFDGICYHSYHNVDNVTSDTLWYASTFEQPLLLGEWNTDQFPGDRIAEDARIRSRLRSLGATIPRLYACYFIWRWEQDARRGHYDIEGNDRRLAVWDGRYALPADDWGGVAPEPTPDPPPAPEPPPEPAMPDFPLPVDDAGNEWQASTTDVRAAIAEVAAQTGCKHRTLLACAIAESGEDHQSQERWHIWTGHGQEAVRQRNWGYAGQVLAWGSSVGAIGTNDYSAGPFHQAWAWWDEFPGNPLDPNDPHRWDAAGWLTFRKRFIQDHGAATRYAATRLLAYQRQRPNDDQWVLERYNKPNEEVSANVRANYARALEIADRILGQGQSALPPPVVEGDVIFEQKYRDHAPAGTFAERPKGVILHGSGSGRASNPPLAEYAGTANWENINPDGLGWNATIGPNIVAVHLSAREWGWNARAASQSYLAVELAQPVRSVPISDEQVNAFCAWFEAEVLPVWPDIPLFFPTHCEVERSGETGQIDGKDDVFPDAARADELRGRIMARLTGRVEPQPEPGPTTPPALDLLAERERQISELMATVEHKRVVIDHLAREVSWSLEGAVVAPLGAMGPSMTKAQILSKAMACRDEAVNVVAELRRHIPEGQ